MQNWGSFKKKKIWNIILKYYVKINDMIQNKLEVISEFLIHLEAWMEYIFI